MYIYIFIYRNVSITSEFPATFGSLWDDRPSWKIMVQREIPELEALI